MSSESSDDFMSCEVCSENPNVNVPSSSDNTPILAFGGLSLIDQAPMPRWQPQEDSDYDSDSDAVNGKRKQMGEEPKTDVQSKKFKKNDMECQEVDSELLIPSETSDESGDCEADNEEEEELEDDEESGEECEHEPEMFPFDDEPIQELTSNTNLYQPSTSGIKRKSSDRSVYPRVPKVKRSSSYPK